MPYRPVLRAIALAGMLACVGTPVRAAYDGPEPLRPPMEKSGHGSLALNGQFVHNVGELQINITNWGLIGSHPGDITDYSEAPSAMWPAGTGVEYLWAAGLWIGAVKNGVPLVSTGQYTPEFMAVPTDPLDTVWEVRRGDEGGRRYPQVMSDDDDDGREDEDPPNGIDDDGDGLIDEDFAILANQQFRLKMRDNSSLVTELWPEHEPLDIEIIQTSFQWEDDLVDDFVGFRWRIENIGTQTLEGLNVGLFADCDIGLRGSPATGIDDLPGFFQGAVRGRDDTNIPLSIAYMYDADGDGDVAPGYFGVMFLGFRSRIASPPGKSIAPGIPFARSFHVFTSNKPFESGGDPDNDADRYLLLSEATYDSVPPDGETKLANDYRFLMSFGPGSRLDPGRAFYVDAALIIGEGKFGMLQTAADATLAYYGDWYDRDNEGVTGEFGRQLFVCATDFGSSAADRNNPIYTLYKDACDTSRGSRLPLKFRDLDKDGCIWINSDCGVETFRRGMYDCNQRIGNVVPDLTGCTGVLGREHRVPWLVGMPPLPPEMRVWQADNAIHVYWNNRSQLVPDLLLNEIDFESYRVWRADDWDRPFGTSIANGPGSQLWSMIAEFDVVNSFERTRKVDDEVVVEYKPLGANTGFDQIRYTPRMFRSELPDYEDTRRPRELVQRILEDPRFAWLDSETDPAEHLRFLDRTGRTTPIGKAYPEIADFSRSWSAIDTAFWVGVGMEFFEYEDHAVLNGQAYFYAVTTTDFMARPTEEGLQPTGHGAQSDPAGNFAFATPKFTAQSADDRARNGQNIFVFPNPATRESLAEFSQFKPNSDDPTGIRVMFANLPAARNTIKIYTLAGDLVQIIEHDGTYADCDDPSGFGQCGGSAYWNLVSRKGQEVVSGIYLYSVESHDSAFDRVVGRFVVVR